MATSIHPPLLLCLYSIPLPLILLQSGRYLHSNRLLQPVVSIATARGPEGGREWRARRREAEAEKTATVPASINNHVLDNSSAIIM